MDQDQSIAEIDDNIREFGFTEMLIRFWRHRALIVILPLLAILLAIFVISVTVWRSDNPVVYYISLKSIENEQYPNGSHFSPQDLLAPAVLSELHTKFKLDPNINLQKYIQVAYDNPITDGVTKKYQNRLASRNLTQTDIDSINTAYQQELIATMRTGLRIDVNFAGIGVDEATGIVIAKALPQIWNRVYTQQFRVLVDTTLSQAAIPTADEALDNTASLLVANERLQNIEHGLQILSDDNRLSSLATANKRNAEDIREELQSYKTVFFDPLFRFGFSSSDLAGRSYLVQHQLAIADLQRQIVGYDQSLEQLTKYHNSTSASSQTPAGTPLLPSGIQLGENALDRVISLADQASFSEYVKQILTARQATVSNMSRLQKEMDWVANTDNSPKDPAFAQAAATGLKSLTADYKELLDRARALLVDNTGPFYIDLTSPRVVGSIFNLHSLILVAGAALAGLAIALIYALLASTLAEAARRDAHS